MAKFKRRMILQRVLFILFFTIELRNKISNAEKDSNMEWMIGSTFQERVTRLVLALKLEDSRRGTRMKKGERGGKHN